MLSATTWTKRMRRFLLPALCLLAFFPLTTLQAETPQPMRLYSRESASPLIFKLNDSDWRWLGEKRQVKLAVYAPDNPPFGLVLESGLYEGLSADYSMLMLRYLGLRFSMLHYSSRSEALAGLSRGEADILIDDSGSQEDLPAGLESSIPYMSDYPALISRETAMAKPVALPPGTRIAIMRGYLSDEWVEQRFPGARLTHYDNAQNALSAVAFGQQDYYLGNLTTASFLIERNYATQLSVADVFSAKETGPRFIVRDAETPLLRAIDAVLASISPVQHKVFFRHWSQGPDMGLLPSALPLTRREKNWLAQHRGSLKVVTNPLYAPFTLTDSQAQFHGIAADVLRLIHLRTGLNFTAVEADSVPAMFKMVRDKKGDFLAAMSHSAERDRQLLFTRPYVLPPFVLVVRNVLGAPADVADINSLAITPDNTLRGWLQKHYPDLTLVDAENASLAMQMVSEGKVDGAVNNLIGAHYMIDRYFRGSLKIAARLGEEPARISFAVGRDQPELHSILNKALADIPPRDISMIANKWQGTPDIKLSTWSVYRSEFYWLAGIFAVLVITSLIWNYYLHREVRLRKDAQKRLEEQAGFLSTLFNSTPLPVYVVAQDGALIDYSPEWETFFQQDTAGTCRLALSAPEHPLSEIWRTLREALDSGQQEVIAAPRYYYVNNGAAKRIILHRAVVFKDVAGNVGGFICSWQDITEHEQLLSDLSSARERAEQANRSKSTFLATMSHEIRTPISAIIGLLELAVTNKAGSQADAESVQVAYQSAQSLLGLIGDILDMAKIESGKLELAPEWVRIDTLVTPVVRVFDGLARQKGIRLQCHIDRLHPDEVWLDPMRLRQILSNLIGNAIKFTEQGAVDVQLHCVGEQGESALLEFIVTDTGVGIAAEEQKSVFNPYVQAESGNKESGTGLGLAICAQLVAMMQGTITLHSRPGRGTRITVQLPVMHRQASVSAAVEQEDHVVSGSPLNILAVDDHPTNRLLLKRQLERLGHRVTEAENGEQAISIWQYGAFDVVITDCSMPVMDGLALTRYLRQAQTSPLTIFGLTANAQAEERERCLAAGMDECLFKPLRLPQLESLLSRIPRRQSAVSAPPPLAALVDLPALMQLAQHDKPLLHTLLKTTRDENARDMQQARALYQAGAWADLARCVHRLAGAAQVVGAAVVEEQGRYLEKLLEQGEEVAQVDRYVENLLSEVMALNQAIDDFLADEG